MLSLFIYIYTLLGRALDRAEHSRRDAYLACAVDMGDLEPVGSTVAPLLDERDSRRSPVRGERCFSSAPPLVEQESALRF